MESKFYTSQVEMFIPPEGYQFDGLIATTMSRHIDTVIQLLLQASEPGKTEWNEWDMKLRLAWMAKQRRCLVFYDGKKEGNKVSSGGMVNSLDGCTIRTVDSLCIPVRRQKTVFHPKLLLARFLPISGGKNAIYRLQVSSKNLTKSEVFEVAAWMESVPAEGKVNHNLKAFLEYLRSAEAVMEPEKKWLETWIWEIEKLSFTMDGAQDVHVTISGDSFGEQAELLEALDSSMVILSPDYETPQENLDKYFVYAPVDCGTHAKLYGKGDTCWLGSSNLSDGGLRSNIECMVRFRTGKPLVWKAGDKANVFGQVCTRVQKAIRRGDPVDEFIRNHTFEMEELQEEGEKKKVSLRITPKPGKANPAQNSTVELLPFGMAEAGGNPKKSKWQVYAPGLTDYAFSYGKKDHPCEGLLRVRIGAKEVLIKASRGAFAGNVDESGRLSEALLREFFNTDWFQKLYRQGKQSDVANEAYKRAEDLLTLDQYRQDIHMYLRYFDWYTGCEEGEKLIRKYPAASTPATNASRPVPSVTGNLRGELTDPRFQKDAVTAVVSAFGEGRLRYLVADETGLGKTHVARGVIETLYQKHQQKQKVQSTNTPFVVYYFGSNVYLLENTLEKLKPSDSKDYQIIKNLDRLSMVFPSLYLTQWGSLKKHDQKYRCTLDAEKINLFGFSANLVGDNKSPKGNKAERKLYEAALGTEKYNEITIQSLREQSNQIAIKGTKNVNQLGYFLKPSLIIVDEFHRYSDILETLGGLQKEAGVPMLMLSATPYVMYPENFHIDTEVVEDEGGKERRQIFRRFEELLAFLGGDTLRNAYERCWNQGLVSQIGLDSLSASLRQYIWRNERSASVEKEYRDLPQMEDWTSKKYDNCMQSACDMQIWCENYADLYPKRYASLCPGVYSFPYKKSPPSESGEEALYKESDSFYKGLNLMDMVNHRGIIPPKEWFMYDESMGLVNEHIEESLPLSLIRNYAAEPGKNLLWMLPTKCLYTVAGDEKAAPFTKLLVFSGYFLVPRMVSAVFSSYVHETQQESIAVPELYRENILDDEIKALEAAYVPDGSGKETMAEVLRRVGENISGALCSRLGWSRAYAAKYAVGSPLVCAYRLTGDTQQARRIAKSFDKYFKGKGISSVLAKLGIVDQEKLLDYCVRHHLQAVLMEYRFCVVGESKGKEARQKYVDKLCEALQYEGSKVNVLCPQNNGYRTAPVSCHFADRFSPDGQDNGVSGTSSSGEGHQKAVENAFNSPFWPMILTTTSAGQEGIDLDRYCSRIMHYSLPVNPMAFEQRDGRVDRRRSLLARRTMNARYEDAFSQFCSSLGTLNYWLWLFSQEMDNSGMRPDWVQEPVDGLRQERIIPFFPLSEEYNAYQELLRWKNMYRGKMGVPTEKVNLSQQPYRLKLNKL